jgi:hypothetical protein
LVGYETIEDGKKGLKHISLCHPWPTIAYFMQKYLNCEGRYSLLFFYHFKLFSHLRHQWLINIPYFLLKSLQLKTHNMRGTKNPASSVTHHGLIKLLILYVLYKKNKAWEAFFQRSHQVQIIYRIEAKEH